MTAAAHVRRGASARTKPRKSARVAMPKKVAKKLPMNQARANKVAGLVFGAFMLAIALVVLLALDIPAKAERSAAAAVGHAGFTVSGYQIVGLNHMDRSAVDDVVTDELRRAADAAGTDKAPQALVDVGSIRERLLRFGWVKDARVLAPPSRHAGHRHRRAQARRAVAEPGPARADRCRGRGARPGPRQPDARPAAADRRRRQRSGGAAVEADGGRADAEAAARLGDVGRGPPLGSQLPVRRNRLACRRATKRRGPRSTSSRGWTSRTACSAAESRASTFAFRAR